MRCASWTAAKGYRAKAIPFFNIECFSHISIWSFWHKKGYPPTSSTSDQGKWFLFRRVALIRYIISDSHGCPSRHRTHTFIRSAIWPIALKSLATSFTVIVFGRARKSQNGSALRPWLILRLKRTFFKLASRCYLLFRPSMKSVCCSPQTRLNSWLKLGVSSNYSSAVYSFGKQSSQHGKKTTLPIAEGSEPSGALDQGSFDFEDTGSVNLDLRFFESKLI